MVGQDLPARTAHAVAASAEPVLRVRGLSRAPALNGVTFVHRGEILGSWARGRSGVAGNDFWIARRRQW